MSAGGEAAVAAALAEELFAWNTPDDPYFVIKGRAGDVSEGDPYIPIAAALLASDALAGLLREARAGALRDAADEIGNPDHPTDALWRLALRGRANQIDNRGETK